MRLLIIFLAQLSLSLCGVFVQKLTWREGMKSKMIKTGNRVDHNNYQENLRAFAYSQKRNITQRIMDFDDCEYLVTVTIGTPPQEFNVLLHTGVTEFWIPSINCKNFACDEKHRFNPAESSTYAKISGKWEIHYPTGNGEAKGEFGEDTVRFGAKNNTSLTIPQVRIGEAMEIGSYFYKDPMDGLLGFGFESHYRDSSVFMEAYKKKLVDEPIFTVYYEKRGKKASVDGGQITFGGVDTDHCGEATYIDLTPSQYWQFTVDRVQMGGSSHEGPFEVVSSTAASFIMGSVDIMSSMLQKISAQRMGSFWVADCATTATFDITIGGKVYSIQPENYVLDHKLDDKCILALDVMDRYQEGTQFVLGAPFIRQFCHIHDMGKKRIGFATILGRASTDK